MMYTQTNITTYLQLYKRPHLMEQQIEAIKNQTINSDIILVHNEGGMKFNYPKDIHHIYSSENMKYHLRFAIALTAKTEYVAFFDDDTIPGNKWFENCLNTIRKYDCICVGNARDINPDGTQSCPAGWTVKNDNDIQCWFGGHAWLMKTEHLKYMWYDQIKEYENGEDIMISANAWLYGNIPTYCPAHPANKQELWSSLDGMRLGSDDVASWIKNKSHFNERIELCKYYLNKQWRPI